MVEDKKKSVPMVEVRSPPARFIPWTRRAPLLACPLRAKSGLCLAKDRRPASLTCTRSSLAEVIVNRFMETVSKLPCSAVPPCHGAKLVGLSSGCTRAQSASRPAALSFWACRLAARVCAAQPGSPSPPTAWPANAASLQSRQAQPTLCRTGTASPRTTLRKSVDAWPWISKATGSAESAGPTRRFWP